MVMKSYSHLNKINQLEYDYHSKMMTRGMPPRAFYNQLTSNIILSMQSILSKSFGTVKLIKSYMSF